MSSYRIRTGFVVAICLLGLLTVAAGTASAQSSQGDEVSSCTTIRESGNYVVSQNITTESEGSCVVIEANDVVLDGGGHGVRGGGLPETVGIDVRADNVTVRDISVENFDSGLLFEDIENGRAVDVSASLNNVGISYDRGRGGQILNSVAYRNNGAGISSFGSRNLLVRGNNASRNYGDGIWVNSGWTVVDNRAFGNEDGDITVRNIEPQETTLVENNTADFVTMFIARTGTVQNNDVESLRVSSAWNVTIENNDIADRLSIREVNESTFRNNSVGSELYITGGFRGMSGTDQRTVCSKGLVVEGTTIQNPTGPNGGIQFADNTTGAVLRDIQLGPTTVSMRGSQNVSVRPATAPSDNTGAEPLGNYLRVTPEANVGRTTLTVFPGGGAPDDAVLYRHSGSWRGVESFLSDDGGVGNTFTLSAGTTVGAFSADDATVDELRVNEPGAFEVECSPDGSTVTVVQENEGDSEDREEPSEAGVTLPVSLPVIGAALVAVLALLAGLVAVRRRRGSSTTVDSGERSNPQQSGAASAAGAARTGEAAWVPFTVRNSAFEPLEVAVQVQCGDEAAARSTHALKGGAVETVQEVPTTDDVRIAASVAGGPTLKKVVEQPSGPVELRFASEHVELGRGSTSDN